MSVLIKSSSLDEVKGFLRPLKINKLYNVQDLVDTILQVTNHKDRTYASLKMNAGSYTNGNTFRLDELWIDMTYQRVVQLTILIEKLLRHEGFNKNAAGVIDTAYRPCSDTRVVWDGLRRCLMVGMCGERQIGVADFSHDESMYETECQEAEAKLFTTRNADSEKMRPEEIFKGKVVYKDTTALLQLDLLKRCGIDVAGLNPKGKTLGGFKAFDDRWQSWDEEWLLLSSRICQESWPNNPQLMTYMWLGLTMFLSVNNDEFYDRDTIRRCFRDYGSKFHPRTLTTPRLNGEPFGSIAYNIVKKVMDSTDSEFLDKLITNTNWSSSDLDMLEELNN